MPLRKCCLKKLQCRMIRLGVPDCFGEVGMVPFLKEKFHMVEKDIEEAVKSLICK